MKSQRVLDCKVCLGIGCKYCEGIEPEAQEMIDKFNKNHPDRKLIFLIKAGSHFFDLNTAQSDKDYRGIYMPSLEEFHKGEGKRRFVEYKTTPGNKTGVKNTNKDVDFNLFSFTFFLDLLARGDFNMMEMLHAPDDKILVDSEEIKALRLIRKALLVNDISAFLGFIKKEYRRYGVNIHHYEQQEKFLEFMNKFESHTRLKDIWNEIKEYSNGNNFIHFTTSRTGNNNSVPSIKIAQRLYQSTVRVDYVTDALKHKLKTYGHRQKNMAKDGVEFKGLYHALRLIYEANDLYDYGEFRLPFSKDRHDMLLKIKTSNIDQDFIFNLIDTEIERLYNREKEVVSNRKTIEDRIDKIKFFITGSKKIEYIRNKSMSS